MNANNSNRAKLTLPPVIAGIIGDRTLTRRIIGRNSQRVYAVGKDLYLKISSNLGELRRERDIDIWLEGKLPLGMTVPRVGAYDEVTDPKDDTTYGYLLTTAVHGTPASSPPYIKDAVRLCDLLAEALHIFHSLSIKGCPAASAESTHKTLIHGDFCLPNIILHRSRVSGFVDLGQVTVGDPWEDYAWCLWSLQYNLKTNAYHPLLLDKLGIAFAPEKYKKYIPYEN
ncbi:MAG: phosphotransferase [Clostridia bacterium]|nr:phosphotransferase [Clostridia bacterium]